MRFLPTLPLLAALLIAGCSPDHNQFSDFWNTPIKRLWQGEEDRGNVRAALTPELLAQIGRPTILLTVPARENVESPFFAEERNGDTVTWLSVNNEFLLLQDGATLCPEGVLLLNHAMRRATELSPVIGCARTHAHQWEQEQQQHPH